MPHPLDRLSQFHYSTTKRGVQLKRFIFGKLSTRRSLRRYFRRRHSNLENQQRGVVSYVTLGMYVARRYTLLIHITQQCVESDVVWKRYHSPLVARNKLLKKIFPPRYSATHILSRRPPSYAKHIVSTTIGIACDASILGTLQSIVERFCTLEYTIPASDLQRLHRTPLLPPKLIHRRLLPGSIYVGISSSKGWQRAWFCRRVATPVHRTAPAAAPAGKSVDMVDEWCRGNEEARYQEYLPTGCLAPHRDHRTCGHYRQCSDFTHLVLQSARLQAPRPGSRVKNVPIRGNL